MLTITVRVCGDYWINPDEVKELLEQNAGQQSILLDLQAEGPSLESLGIVDCINQYCEKYQVNYSDIHVTYWSNTAEALPYNLVHTVYLSHFFEFSKNYWKDTLEEPTYEYVFGYFIGRRAIPRAAIMYYLSETYGSRNLLSCLKTNLDQPWKYPGTGVNLDHIQDWIPADKLTAFQTWWDNNPITSIDNHNIQDQYTAGNNTNKDLVDHYHKFDIEIVSESYCRGNTFFPTEKTVRPLMAAKPFIAYGPANHMQRLQGLGFETFNSVWSEEYDRYEGRKRWEAMKEVIDTIMLLDPEDRITMINQAVQIAERNRQHLSSLIN